MKIGIVEPVGGHRGMHFYDFGLSLGISNAGSQVTLYTCDETTPLFPEKFQTKLMYKKVFGNQPKYLRGLRHLYGSIKSAIDARKCQIEIIHLHSFHYDTLELLTTVIFKLFGFRVINTIHDVESFIDLKFSGLLRKVGFLITNHFIVHNEFSKSELIKTGLAPEPKISIVKHGNYLMFNPPEKVSKENKLKERIDPEKFTILFFGQIKKVKGLEILLNALSHVVESNKNVQLIIAGTVWKSDIDFYTGIIEDRMLNDYVVLDNRYIPDNEIKNYFDAADLVVLPYHRIYQSGVLLKAMSYKKPVLVSDLPAMIEIVKDGLNGFVFKSGSSESLGEKICSIIEQSHKLAEVGNRGFQLIDQEYNWNNIGVETIKVYQKNYK